MWILIAIGIILGLILSIGVIAIFSYSLRWRWVSTPILHWLRTQQPPLSASERDVVEAGTVWWEQQFFNGRPDWAALWRLPKLKLSEEEQAFISGPVEKLCGLLNDWESQAHQNLPADAWRYIKEARFWGLVTSPKYGGYGFSACAHSAIITKIATRSISAAITVMVPNALGPGEFLSLFGTEAQKQYYLPRLVKGEEIGCFALTSLEGGSDAAHITDVGIVCRGMYQGQEVLGIQLNFKKRYISLAPIATLIAVVFQLYDPDHLLEVNAPTRKKKQTEKIGMTVAVVPSHLPGIEIGDRHNCLNLPFLNGPVNGTDVFISFDCIPGGSAACGQGWRMMMECLSAGRGISLPALSAAISQFCFRTTGAYAQIRQQFNRPIGEFEGVALVLAKIAGLNYISEAVRLFTVQALDQGLRPAIGSAIAKYHLTEFARLIGNAAMDVHGGKGIQCGPRNYLAMIYQALPINITVEGANILTRNLIIFGQGVLRCHPYLSRELVAASDPQDPLKNRTFDRLLWQHVRFMVSNFFWCAYLGWTGGRGFSIKQKTRMKSYLRQLTRMSTAFSWVSDLVCIKLGKTLKQQEALTARLGDVLSYLYMASATVKLYQEREEPLDEWPWLQWSLDYCLFHIQQAFHEFFQNFPFRRWAIFMRFILFPWGKRYAPPLDSLSFQVATEMQNPGEIRDHFSRYCYIGDESQAVARLDQALRHWKKTRAAWKKLHEFKFDRAPMDLADRIEYVYQQGVLTDPERDDLLKFSQLYKECLAVDSFKWKGNPNENKIQ